MKSDAHDFTHDPCATAAGHALLQESVSPIGVARLFYWDTCPCIHVLCPSIKTWSVVKLATIGNICNVRSSYTLKIKLLVNVTRQVINDMKRCKKWVNVESQCLQSWWEDKEGLSIWAQQYAHTHVHKMKGPAKRCYSLQSDLIALKQQH